MRVIQISACDSQSEKELVDELRRWNHPNKIGGVAFVGLNTPEKIDALVLTPKGCTVIEVKGVTSTASGRVEVPENATWTSETGPLSLRLQDGAANPIHQVQHYAFSVKKELAKELPGAFINGLVLLVQHHDIANRSGDKVIRIDDDFAVYTGKLNGIAATTLTRFHQNRALRKYFHNQPQAHGRKNRDWDIESAETLFRVLGLRDAPTGKELEEEDFRPRSEVNASVALPPKKKPARAKGSPSRSVCPSTPPTKPQRTTRPNLSPGSSGGGTTSAPGTGTPPARAEGQQPTLNPHCTPPAPVPTSSLPPSPPRPATPSPWLQPPPSAFPLPPHPGPTREGPGV